MSSKKPRFVRGFLLQLIFAAMAYHFFRTWVRLALWCYVKKITLHPAEKSSLNGPLMLASNHPNSFLDAIVVGTHMKIPMHFMTRGDVFAKPRIKRFLESLHMIPIFRIRDGINKLAQNDEGIQKSVDALGKKHLLIIFVEGFCINQTELQRPLKKGAARILQACWQQNIPARILPTWIKYNSHSRFAKTIDIRFGDIFDQKLSDGFLPAQGIQNINSETEKQLLALSAIPQKIPYQNPLLKALLFLPAMLAAVLNAPLFLPVQALAKKLNGNAVHYDSMMLLFLMVLYPFYVLIICSILFGITGSGYVWLLFLAMPLLAKVYAIWR